MRAYLIRRLLLIIPSLFLLTIIVFLAVRFLPGNIVDAMVAEMEVWYAAGADIDREALSVCWDWTCLSTCSMDAG